MDVVRHRLVLDSHRRRYDAPLTAGSYERAGPGAKSPQTRRLVGWVARQLPSLLRLFPRPVIDVASHLLDLGFLLVAPGVRSADPRFEISVSRQAVDLIHPLLDLKLHDVVPDALQHLLLVVDLLSLRARDCPSATSLPTTPDAAPHCARGRGPS